MRAVLALLLLLAAASARADWVKVESGNTGFFSASDSVVYYIDPSSLVREGGVRRIWEIHDLRDKGEQGERSVLASVEYDCAGKRMRTLRATGRSLPMARGEIIPLRGVFGDWVALEPGKDDRIYFRILDAVCAL